MKRSRFRRRNTRTSGRSAIHGFTLIEVMIAVFVLGTVAASCLMVLRVSFLQMETVRNNALASQILQSEMENMRLTDWSEVAALTDGEFDIDDTFAGNSHAKNFERRRFVKDIGFDMREVTLEVAWTGQNGATSTRRYVTYFAKYGITDYYFRSFTKNQVAN